MRAEEKKIIPIGYEDFKEIIDKNLYFVDKSPMIRELIDSAGKILLLTRPRRFGKTLNLSMIRRFFEDERTAKGEKIDNGYLFEELSAAASGEKYLRHQQQYPVISLSLKSSKQPNFPLAYEELKKRIAEEFDRHRYVLNGSALSEAEKKRYRAVRDVDDRPSIYSDALGFLSRCLAKYHGENVVILVDEYDVPLENAWFAGFYDEMIAFIRSLFESALKTNPYLERGVVTGCLQISRESIFTGLNNLQIHSLLDEHFADSFGFTEREVGKLLAYYELDDKYEELQSWYDGYRFGNAEIYNPWSILNYVDAARVNRDAFPRAYWSNTSSNSIVRELVEEADSATRKELEELMDSGTVEKPVHEEITYGDIHESKDNLWNFLFFTGYLKMCGQRQEGEQIYLTMEIPNKEVRSIYRQSILRWFDKKMERMDRSPLICALEEGDCEAAEEFVSAQLMDTISYFDYAESYYHGFLAGLLKGSEKYTVLSNRESGTGRADLALQENKFRGRAVILELKIADKFSEMEAKCSEALRQIEEQNYGAAFAAEGCGEILKYGVCFFKKGCMIKRG